MKGILMANCPRHTPKDPTGNGRAFHFFTLLRLYHRNPKRKRGTFSRVSSLTLRVPMPLQHMQLEQMKGHAGNGLALAAAGSLFYSAPPRSFQRPAGPKRRTVKKHAVPESVRAPPHTACARRACRTFSEEITCSKPPCGDLSLAWRLLDLSQTHIPVSAIGSFVDHLFRDLPGGRVLRMVVGVGQ